MGIALKRRDYAPIVKEIYSGVIKIILNERNEEKIKRETLEYFRKMVDDLLEGNIGIDKLIITQSLRADYSNPTTIKHKILADRIGKRDPGNKPASNDRIPYCYIDLKNLRCYKKGCDKKIINTKKCKCRGCMELFCGVHLNSHECEIVCRFCRVPREICSVCISGEKGHCNCNVKECKTCLGWYCPDDMIKHDQFIIKKTGEVDHTRNKCKKPIDLKTILGDVVEDPTFIKENNLSIDYRRYLDNQISKPILQIFSLMVENPNQILHDILIGDDNRKSGMKSIGSYFGGGFSNSSLKKEIKSKQKKCVEESKNKTVAIKKQITMNNFFNTKPVNLDDMLRDIKNKRKVIKDKSKKKEDAEKKVEKKKVDKKDNVKIEIKKMK